MTAFWTHLLLSLVVATILAAFIRALFLVRNEIASKGTGEFWGFIERKFDVISLLLLLLVLLSAALYFHQIITDTETSWLEQTITTILGAYIGLTQTSKHPPEPPVSKT
jgi:hypothetical protein